MITQSKTSSPLTRSLISPVLTGICCGLMLLAHWLYPVGVLFYYPVNAIGLLTGGLGLTIVLTAHQQFKKAGTTLYPFDQPGKLITDGLFQYTRNPMYLGLTIFLAGVWLGLNTFTPGLFVVVFLLLADRWYIAYEEQTLLAVFGEKYAAYQAITPRWIVLHSRFPSNRSGLRWMYGVLTWFWAAAMLPRMAGISSLHTAGGIFLLVGGSIHALRHQRWIKTVVLETPPNFTPALRRRRRLFVATVLSGFLCGVSGLAGVLMHHEQRICLPFWCSWIRPAHIVTGLAFFGWNVLHIWMRRNRFRKYRRFNAPFSGTR